MDRRYLLLFLTLTLILFALLLGCVTSGTGEIEAAASLGETGDSPSEPDPTEQDDLIDLGWFGAPARVMRVRWEIENIDPALGARPTVLSINFRVYLAFQPHAYIDSVRSLAVYLPSHQYWTIDLDRYWEPEGQYVGGRGYWHTKHLDPEGALFPIGVYNIELDLEGRGVAATPFTVFAPGDTRLSGRYIYTEEYEGYRGPNHIPALRRAEILSAVHREEEVDITFRVDDPRVGNGDIRFRDRSGSVKFLSKPFYDWYEREPLSELNDGAGLYTDGRANRIVLSPEELRYYSEEREAEVVDFYIVLYDGTQFIGSGNPARYRHISRSAPFPRREP